MPEVNRTLVKSAPELWAELSDLEALGRHLAPFGEIRITRCTPESQVDWEAARATGAIRLEPSGFGTRVTLTARPAVVHAAAPEPEPPPEPPEPAQRGFWGRLFRRRAAAVHEEAPPPPEPQPQPQPQPQPAAAMIADHEAVAALNEVLDTLGAAHHRPFSRS